MYNIVMKILSWNVNGLRAIHKKNVFLGLIEKEDPDILCLQEIKAEADQLPEEIRNITGYYSYFDSSKGRKGYSGVAVYTKELPEKVEFGIGVPEFDCEGRLIIAYFKDFVLINTYFPNGGGGPERLRYKLHFYDAFLSYVDNLRKSGKKVIFCGDVNTAHEEIDLARPKENEKNTGFLPEERAWLDEVVNHGYVDVFRNMYQNKKDVYTYWDMKTFARERNVGWRIDYFFVSSDLLPKIKSFKTYADVYGSDHCPIGIELRS